MASGYKVVLLGEGRVGKTSLVSRFAHDAFDENQSSTIQASMYTSADVPLLDGSGAKVKINVWDTAGQERFHALGPIYYRNADGALLVYDITDADTLEKVRLWIRELRAVVGDQIQLVICGNKSDREEERDIRKEKAEEFAKSHEALHFVTSAKTGENVAVAFQALATAVATASGGRGSGGGATNTGGTNNAAVTAARGRRKRRGLLRIEDDWEEERLAAGGQNKAERGSHACDRPAARGATGVSAPSGEDYTCSGTQKSRRPGPATVNLSAAATHTARRPSGSSGSLGCCG
ncbi:putative ras-related protein Rab21 [Trypanosoma cruzi]|uniref:Ras-related protein Rab-21 n=2 Tax=Trypanosoma cruzi TaxID=5693 RepID=Q4DBX8_TRYCC|nr:small GTPase, putative [Trypanosoma cruzi]EAN90037.1 small GTPase, putative [Trypanosoma cruzi]PWV20308.1 putative ras-related protein Rab21 [Trypanosoma cruzi]RNC42077.1 small GTPase [Trypanosoma cruzi]|eukprot:XP_811888.1 small GTPase [Trypanosoma cruzi strain CL Brener]